MLKAVRIVAFARNEHRISCEGKLSKISDNFSDCWELLEKLTFNGSLEKRMHLHIEKLLKKKTEHKHLVNPELLLE